MIPARIFADHAAGSAVRPEVADLLAALYRDGIGNPNGGHAEARRSRAVLDEARASLAAALGVESRQITFTASASEGLALALNSETRAKEPLLTSATEHRGARALAQRHAAAGGAVHLLPVDERGAWVTNSPINRDVASQGGVALLTLASGELGTIQPRADLFHIWREAGGGALILDAVQAAAAAELRFDEVGAAHLVIGSAKVEGPAGIAALISAPDRRLHSLVPGGGQERGRRGGTEAVPLAAAFAHAYRLMSNERHATQRHLAQLAEAFDAALGNPATHGLIATGASDLGARLPGHRSYAAEWALGDDLVAALDHAGLAISTGSACNSGSREPSEALAACGLSVAASRGGIRISFGRTNSVDEARLAAASLAATCARIRSRYTAEVSR
jgi:cysteine desulfurase